MSLAAETILDDLVSSTPWALLDVRSPKEFAKASCPFFQNMPILTDEERHQVGLTYKNQGQTKAIELGLELTAPQRGERIEAWQKRIEASLEKKALVICWRGGLRSKMAVQWLRESGYQAWRLAGGYKALRRELLSRLENSPCQFWVITGLTGTGKTELLEASPLPTVHLEALAQHRGSCFGGHLRAQPSQATFENAVALSLHNKRLALIEDESRKIGQRVLPKTIKEKMTQAPIIHLQASMDERLTRLYREYVEQPLASQSATALQERLQKNLYYLRHRLGGLRYQEATKLLRDAFASRYPEEAHRQWIHYLLKEHYDPTYEHAFARLDRPCVFKGNFAECQDWLNEISMDPSEIANDEKKTHENQSTLQSRCHRLDAD